MKEHFDKVLEIIKEQDINACITGSCMLGYNEKWMQDIDVFCYDKSSFNKFLFFMHYNSLFTILEPLEKYKFDEYINKEKSSLDSIGLITIKFKYNLLIDVNVVFKKFQNSIFDVLSNFDLDIIAIGYDIKTKKTLSLRESEGLEGTWNIWNKGFYENDQWSCKRILRQFERIVKYSMRGYNLDKVTDKYIELVENVLNKENFYKSKKGEDFYNDTKEKFELVLQILRVWKKDKQCTPEQLYILKTLI